jgi:hypothetical protein
VRGYATLCVALVINLLSYYFYFFLATCERCGSVGIKHAFYSKSKRFCSLSCSRSFATAKREGKPLTTFEKISQVNTIKTIEQYIFFGSH